MADASDTPAQPAKKPRKAAARKAAVDKAAPARASKKATGGAEVPPHEATFAESAQQAKVALGTAGAAARAKIRSVTEAVSEKVSTTDWKAQGEQAKTKATHLAKEAADVARAKTGSAMEGLSKLISETARTVDSKLGPNYGDYARQAAEAVAGAAKSFDAKDIDKLLGEARDFVRKSPAVSIGAAAVAGFVLMRLAKGGSDDGETEDGEA